MVYFICALADNLLLVKIGRTSRSIQTRIRDLQVGSPLPLSLVVAEEGGEKREKQLHHRFGDSRCHGEWFVPSQKMMDYIYELTCDLIPSLVNEVVNDPTRLNRIATSLGWPVDKVLDEMQAVSLEAEAIEAAR